MNDNFNAFFQRNRGKIFGGLIGLIVGLVLLEYGIFKGLLLAGLVALGVYFGASEENRARAARFWHQLFSDQKE